MKKLTNCPRKGLIESLLTKLMTFPLLWQRSHQESFKKGALVWKVCKGCHQSKTLMSDSLPNSTKLFLAMIGPKLKAAVGLQTGQTTLRAHTRMFKRRLIWWQDCWLCGDEKKGDVCIVCHCPALTCKRYKTLGYMFLKPKDLEDMCMNGHLISLVANTWLGIVP